jgi:hypothetical protein
MMDRSGLERLVSNHLLTNISYGFTDRQVEVNWRHCGIDRFVILDLAQLLQLNRGRCDD